MHRYLFSSLSIGHKIDNSNLNMLIEIFRGIIPYVNTEEVEEYIVYYGNGDNTKSIRNLSINLIEKNWENISNFTPLEFVHLKGLSYRYMHEKSLHPDVFAVYLHFGNCESPTDLKDSYNNNTLDIVISTCALAGNVPYALQKHLVNFNLYVFKELKAYCGYITIDYVDMSSFFRSSPYEIYNALRPNFSENLIRGYYWGNLISVNQLKLLGGEKALLSPLFLFKTQKINNVGYYIQLTEDINTILTSDREKLSLLKNFLSPLLPLPNEIAAKFSRPHLPDLLM